jgi:hypothetical protein
MSNIKRPKHKQETKKDANRLPLRTGYIVVILFGGLLCLLKITGGLVGMYNVGAAQ